MKVRECQEGTEYYFDDEYTDGVVKCPVCSDVWLSMDANENVGSCQHIRFFYSTFIPGSFSFFGDDWDHASFEKSFRKLSHFDDGDCYTDEEQAFRDINHPDVDTVIWMQEEGMGTSYQIYWGYKT
jgi:hypothetical protein|tara:strand:+ start:151 stop:528 length:378 start_codon:yes stop_codon:yes gene_type:complete